MCFEIVSFLLGWMELVLMDRRCLELRESLLICSTKLTLSYRHAEHQTLKPGKIERVRSHNSMILLKICELGLRWPVQICAVSEIDVMYLSREQQVRGGYLDCFANHPRSDNFIRSFQEGVGISGVRLVCFVTMVLSSFASSPGSTASRRDTRHWG